MNLFPLFRSFLPLRNPIGFGVSDFLVLAIAVLLVILVLAKAWLAPYIRRLADRTGLCMALLFALPILLRLALLAQNPPPIPSGADDFGYVLLGDTLRHFRLANPPHALPQFFEAVFILQRPTYSSIYPLGQGIVLMLGWAGILICSGAFSALCYWMLRAWVAPKWALIGGLLAVIQFGPLSPWVNSYWGGLLSACAGCLVFGILPRLRQSPQLRHGALLGLGLALQILTRPFETLFLAIAAGIYLALAYRSSLKPLLAATAPVAAALLLMLLQNKAVTKNWTTMPYVLSRYEYGVPTTFTFQPNPVPHQALTPGQELDYKAQAAIHGCGTDTPADYLNRLLYRMRYLRFFLLPPLYLALVAFIPALRQKRHLWALGTLALFALGTNFYPFFYPHYVAAVTCLVILLSVIGLARLSRIESFLLPLSAAFFAFWFLISLFGNPDLLPVADYQTWNYINRGDPQGRIAVSGKLAHSPGQQLVFVRYSPAHRFEEWVHNAADIDSAQTVWANDLGSDENQKLLNYYPNRKPWLLEPDRHPPLLSPYPNDSGLFQTVH